MPGSVALVGSGEYLPVMAPLEASLLADRPPRYVQLPTAAAEEGAGSVARWVALGDEQAQRLGVEAVPVMVLDRDTANDDDMAQLVRGAGLVYLSGGSPGYLADTLRETRVWAAIIEEWRSGAALAGCSAGAMALTGWVPDIRRPDAEPRPGLDILPMLRVMPHFDRLVGWAPQLVESMAAQVPPGVSLIGIDEETAIVSDGEDLRRWTVYGQQAAWLLTAEGRTAYAAGQQLVL